MARVAEMEVLADRVKVTSITGDGIIVATLVKAAVGQAEELGAPRSLADLHPVAP